MLSTKWHWKDSKAAEKKTDNREKDSLTGRRGERKEKSKTRTAKKTLSQQRKRQ